MSHLSPNPAASLTPSPSMSRSPTITEGDTSSGTQSPTRTLTDLNASLPKPADSLPATSTIAASEKELVAKGEIVPKRVSDALSSLPNGKKSFLLLAFCVSMFIDASSVSATFLLSNSIATDLNISFANEAWILASYSMIFAACLLFAGRIADLYPPHLVYISGFIGIAILNLVISFMENDYAFYVLRALSAIVAVLTIPSSINMIIQMYPDPEEQGKKLALFGMAGALANTISLILAGLFLLASWRWFFRFITFVSAPLALAAWFLLPKTESVADDLGTLGKWKRMDLGGVFLIVAALILFTLGFTQAPLEGWNTAIFIAPFVISIVLFAAFFTYEHLMPRGFTLLPHDLWTYPNIWPLIFQASSIFMWFATGQLRLATYFQAALGDSAILAAVKLLPMGITALVVGVATQAMPWLINRPKYVQPISSALCFAGSMLWAFSGGGHGNDYWRYIFPGEIIGTAGGMIIFISMNTQIIQSFPLAFAGVGGSFANVIFQVGGIIGVAIQAGLIATGNGTVEIATGNGTVEDWIGSRNGYLFTSCYVLFTGIVFLFWYDQKKMPKREGVVAAV